MKIKKTHKKIIFGFLLVIFVVTGLSISQNAWGAHEEFLKPSEKIMNLEEYRNTPSKLINADYGNKLTEKLKEAGVLNLLSHTGPITDADKEKLQKIKKDFDAQIGAGIIKLDTGEKFKFELWPYKKFNITDKIYEIINKILFAIFSLFGWLLALVGKLYNIFFRMEIYTNLPLVKTGWGVTRDFANIFFSIILLIMALASILKIETYGLKKLLPQLILIALLINFSLVIAGMIIDASQVLLHFFIDQIQGDSISGRLAEALVITEVLKGDAITKEAFGSLGDHLNVLMSLIFGIIIIIIAAFALALGVGLLAYRMFMLWFLLIGAPMVWLANILPRTQQYWGQWWSSFINWCFVGPVYAFFIWLAITSTGELKEAFKKNLKLGLEAPGFVKQWYTDATFFFNYLIIIGLLVGAFLAAQKLGGQAGGLGLKAGQWMGKKAGNWAKRRSKEELSRLSRPAVTKATEFLSKSRIPGAQRLARVPIAWQAKQEAAIAEKSKGLEALSSDNIKTIMATSSGAELVAASQILAKRGDLEEGAGLTDKKIKSAVVEAGKYGRENDLLKTRLDLCRDDDKDEQLGKVMVSMKPDDMLNLREKDLATNPRIIAIFEQLLRTEKFTSQHLAKLTDNPGAMNIINQQIIQNDDKYQNLPEKLQRYLEKDSGASVFYHRKPPEEEKPEKPEKPVLQPGEKLSPGGVIIPPTGGPKKSITELE